MKLPPHAKRKARIEIIPMIDTMFFLLVFFMIATLSMTLQRGMPVNLPESSTATGDIPNQVSLTLAENGDLFFNKEPVTVREIAPRLQDMLLKQSEPSVVINADKAVPHGRVVAVMDAVRKTGITAMAIATGLEKG